MLKALSLASLMLATPVALSAQVTDPAGQRIDAYNQAVLAVMKEGPKLGAKGRAARFNTISSDFYTMQNIAAIVAGPKWASASQADKDSLVAALTRHSAASLASNFDSFNGEKFTVNPKVVTRGAERLVSSSIAPKTGSPTTLIYRMRSVGGQWKILDVLAEGVSQLALQRSDFAATAATGIPALVKKIDGIDAKMLSGH